MERGQLINSVIKKVVKKDRTLVEVALKKMTTEELMLFKKTVDAKFKKPSVALLLGIINLDRFYLKESQAFLKFITFGGFLVWTILDLFTVRKRTRILNSEMLVRELSLFQFATKI
ncbi:TM2 domain-containing protein [Mesomycoplasma lagogenitalium]|uniref:TM2 domain-containing protein n=1 Tax=Mesomycoplasma lagogenitalium TaxID=171286 RepID=A0ABY8LX05_9BACT|nr:TM2 domain-containing protein [Mesomycoplasma lagogenitalium]WGI36791.1 TM2 domain-containing protein [Mesomycoplasma lagogenitalium]